MSSPSIIKHHEVCTTYASKIIQCSENDNNWMASIHRSMITFSLHAVAFLAEMFHTIQKTVDGFFALDKANRTCSKLHWPSNLTRKSIIITVKSIYNNAHQFCKQKMNNNFIGSVQNRAWRIEWSDNSMLKCLLAAGYCFLETTENVFLPPV